MASQDSEELKELKKHMRSVRNSDYRAAFGLIKTDLGLPPKTSDAEIEALLIYAARDCFGESLDADMVLSAFGLLKGFDNQHNTEEPKDADVLITARRKMFIKKSSYVSDRHGPNHKRRKVYYRSYNEVAAAGEYAVKAVINALGSEDGSLINEVAQKLYSHKRSIRSYLEESKEYLDVDENKCVIGVKLPELIHVNQDATPHVKDGAGGGSQAATGGAEGSEFCNPTPKQDLEQLKFLLALADYISENYKKLLAIIVAIFLGIVLTIVALGGTIKHTKTRTVRPDGFREDPRLEIQEWVEESVYKGPLAKEHAD